MKFNKNKIFLSFLTFSFLSFLFFMNFSFVHATNVEEKGEVSLDNPLETDSPQIFIGRIIDASLGIVGSLALLMFVYGGFIWMLASGNSERVEKGKNILFWATVGLVVIFTSYIIVHFVIFELIGAPGTGS